MKWVLISSNPRQQIYELWNNEKKLLVFTYHVIHGTIRIISEEPRVFLLRKEGFLKNRTVLMNEYGIKIATLTEETESQTGSIEIDEKKLHYSIHNRLYKEVFIYSADSEKLLITCD